MLINEIVGKGKKNVLLVGHGGICKAVIGNLLGNKIEELKKIDMLKNTSVSEYIFDGKKWEIVKFNDMEHLE